jgi:hypothetical protein
MTPQQLGFDPSMKLFISPQKQLFSYELELAQLRELFRKSALYYKLNWMIRIQDKTYVTIRGLSLSRAEVMCGRGQLVWAAVEFKQRKQEQEHEVSVAVWLSKAAMSDI